MKRIIALAIVAIIAAHLLGGGMMAQGTGSEGAPTSPISQNSEGVPQADENEDELTEVLSGLEPDSTEAPIYGATPQILPTITATPVPVFIPISPIFHSPIATPGRLMCVAAGHWGQVLCYEVQ